MGLWHFAKQEYISNKADLCTFLCVLVVLRLRTDFCFCLKGPLTHWGGAFREQNNIGEGSLTSLKCGFVALEHRNVGHMLELLPMVSFC